MRIVRKAEFDGLPEELESAVGAYRQALEHHRTTVGEPAPWPAWPVLRELAGLSPEDWALEGHTRVRDGEAWVQVEDHRGRRGWIDGAPVTVTEPGPLPEGWSDEPPPVPPPAPRVSTLTVIERLEAVGKRKAAREALMGDDYLWDRFWAAQSIRCDDEEASALLMAIGADPVAILAPEQPES